MKDVDTEDGIECTIGGVGLTRPQIDLLGKRGITLLALEDAAKKSDTEGMRRYIYDLLDSRGGQDEAGGPGRDYNYGSSN
jgi:hypothetical protein